MRLIHAPTRRYIVIAKHPVDGVNNMVHLLFVNGQHFDQMGSADRVNGWDDNVRVGGRWSNFKRGHIAHPIFPMNLQTR